MPVHRRNTLVALCAAIVVIGAGLFFAQHAMAQTPSGTLQASELGLQPIGDAMGTPLVDIRIIIARIIRAALGLLGIVALGLVLYAGFLWMTAGGNEEKISESKKLLINSVIGLAIILSAFSIASYIIGKLVDATAGGGGGGGIITSPNPYFSGNLFYVDQMPAGGTLCVRNPHLLVVFNRGVVIDAGLQNNIIVEKAGINGAVPGAWQYKGQLHNIIEWVPNGSCAPEGGNDCLDASTTYNISFKDKTKIKAEGNSSLLLNCSIRANCNTFVSFTTGQGVDRVPPTIQITSPANNDGLPQNSNVPVVVNYQDDNGIQNVALDVDNYFVTSQSVSGCQKTGQVTLNWPTQHLDVGDHNIHVVGYDWSAQEGEDRKTVHLIPSHCFDNILQTDQDLGPNLGETEVGPIACGGECPACGGASCHSDQECASNFCQIPPGVCVDKMRITDVSPLSGSAGTYVSVMGYFFGNGPGHIYFGNKPNAAVNNDADWVEASLVQCTAPVDTWTPWQILVESPVGITGDVPIKVVTASTTGKDNVVRSFTDVTNDGWGPQINNYVYNNTVRPGLCAVNPSSQVPGGTVQLSGKNLGTLSQPNINKVIFGGTNGRVSFFTKLGNVNWTDSLIQEVFVPELAAGIVSVSAVNATGVQSNGLRFVVDQGVGSDAPVIYSVMPGSGTRADYITITGKNFGTSIGNVLFATDRNDNLPLTGSFNFPDACGTQVWQPNQIIVKFNQSQGSASTTYLVRVRTSDAKLSAFDDNAYFTLTNGVPAPGVCKIDPISGPVPMPGGATVKVYGENFGANPAVYFWGASGSPTTTAGRIQATIVSTSTVQGASVLSTLPQPGTITGAVVVASAGRLSNGYNFTVNDCTVQDTCSALGNYTCCSSGFERGLCKPTNGPVCGGTLRSSAYIWRFSTQDIPPIPRVMERCDATSEAGMALPTPSPSALWDAKLPDPNSGDHHNVCRNAVSVVEFSTVMDQATVNAGSVHVYRCLSVDGNNCTLRDNQNGDNGVVVPAVGSFTLRQSYAGGGGNQRQYIEIRPPAGTWSDRFWYQVVLDKTIRSDSPSSSLNLLSDRPCGGNSAYCYVFKTDSQDCKMRAVVITPYAFWTDVLEAPIKYRSPGRSPTDFYYQGNGLSNQRCVMMDVAGFNWSWSSSNTAFAAIFPTNTPANTRRAQAAAYANTVAVGLVNPDDAVNINAVAATSGVSYVGHSPLTIDLTNPAVKDFWPNCQQACTNAQVGAQFSVAMSPVNVNWQSVRLYRCLDENCLAVVLVSTNTLPNFDAQTHRTLTLPHNELIPNTIYKVVLSSANDGALQLWSAGNLFNPMATSSPFQQEFSWRFITKKDACQIDHVDVTPANFMAQTIHDKAVYQVQAFSQPDQCNSLGQKLDPWTVNWSWQSSDPLVASTTVFNTRGYNRYCTNECIKKGSDVPSGVLGYTPLCGNGIVEAGEDCDAPSSTLGCGLDCRWLGHSNVSVCGNGIVEQGEACDTKDATSSIGCTAQCTHAGSARQVGSQNLNASVCGNGFIGSGEDCDIGIADSPTNTLSRLGCTATCLHQGTRLSSAWCANNNALSGFGVGAVALACQNSFSVCGDGQTSPDEDVGCDLNNGNHAQWCNTRCLANDAGHNKCTPNAEGCDANGQYIGASLMYSVPSVCGDTIAGFGENPSCENNLTLTHGALIDPWALATGVGRGTPTGTPPAQVSLISAATNQLTKGGTIKGAGKFTIACGFNNDSECAAVYGQGYGVGYDSCCYARPRLVATIPVTSTPVKNNVCRNTALIAVFDHAMDPNSLPGNILIARGQGFAQNVVPAPTHTSYLGTDNDNSPFLKLASPMPVATKGNYAYVANWLTGALDTIDISNKEAPVHVAQISPNNNNQVHFAGPSVIKIQDDYLYVFSRSSHALDILSIADPAHPTPVGYISEASDNSVIGQTLPIKGGYSMDVQGNYAYLGDYSANFHVIDITDKAHPVHVGAMVGGPDAMKVSGRYAYVVRSSWFRVIDLINPTSPVEVGIANQFVSGGWGVAVSGTYAFVAGRNNNEIKVYSVATPTAPVLVASRPTVGVAPMHLELKGHYLFITEETSHSVEVMDVSNPLNLQPAGFIQDGSGGPGSVAHLRSAYDIAISGNYALVTAQISNALEIIDLSSYFNPPTDCGEDVTTRIAQLQNNPVGSWIARVWRAIVNGVRTLFGLPATAIIYTPPPRWCAGLDTGSIEVVPPSNATGTSEIVLHLDQPLEAQTNYAVVLKEGLRDIRGVALGTSTVPNNLNYNWKFNTGNEICKVQSATVQPTRWLFSRAGATTTLAATALAQNGEAIQAIPGFYNWEYIWGPKQNDFVTLQNTTSSHNIITAQNRNGELDVGATVNITVNSLGSTTGTVAFGKSHITVFLCENPWPPKSAMYGNNGPFVIFPYEDSLTNNDYFANPVTPSPPVGFDNTANPPAERAARPADGYFNFSTYYCADNGGNGKSDDLPFLKPTLQYTAASLVIPDNGSCEYSGESCSVQNDCGVRYQTDLGSLVVPVGVTSICGAATTTPSPLQIPFLDQNGKPVSCVNAVSCATVPGFTAWTHSVGNSTCIGLNAPHPLQCFKYAPLKRFLFSNDLNDDVIGIQIFPNPQHLTPSQWFKNDKQTGGQGFLGNPQKLSGGVDGNDAVSDGNNVYVEAFNYTSSTENNQVVGNLYTNIYLFSINTNATAETRKVFDQFIRNVRFNTNLTNFGFCGSTVTSSDFTIPCSNDLQCPASQVCSRQVGKLKNNYQRLRDLKQMDLALESYASVHNGSYPALATGSFLKGQTLSVWPSWTALGSALGAALPNDPVNKLGLAGTCKTDVNIFCTTSNNCPTINQNTSTRQACVIHDPTGGTGWSTDDRRFSFACVSSSMAYRYTYVTSTGYQMYTNFEDPGIVISQTSLQKFFDAFGYSNPARLGVTNQWKTDTICLNVPEISTLNDGKCGDGIVNWDKGEKCDPPGALKYNSCVGNQIQVDYCTRPGQPNIVSPGCQWVVSTTIACSALSKCGNGSVEAGEQCDDGKLNGTYNHCNNNCQGFGAGGYCGNSVLDGKQELCDPTVELSANNAAGWCIGGQNIGAYCSVSDDLNPCNSQQQGYQVCAEWDTFHVKYALNKNNSCNGDCQSRGPYCGDGIVQTQFGEQCDPAQKDLSCNVNGAAGVVKCTNTCRFGENAILWLTFDDQFIDNSNNVFADASGNGNNATCARPNNCPEFIAGPNPGMVTTNNAARFAAPNKLVISDKPSLNPTSSFSAEVWLSPGDGDNENWNRILEKGGWGKGGGYALHFIAATRRVEFRAYGPGPYEYYSVESQNIVNIDDMRHVVATFVKNGNTKTIKIYINGADDTGEAYVHLSPNPLDPAVSLGVGGSYVGPLEFLTPSTNEQLYIGSNGYGNDNYYGGYMDELHLYNYALAPNQVAAHFADTSGNMCSVVANNQPVKVAAGGCGDGKVDANEACDNGANNGVACSPQYGKSCSYCAADCKNVVDVQPVQYCGNGIIEAAEKCDLDPVNNLIFNSSRAASNTVYSVTNTQHNGFLVRTCDSELNIPVDAFQKGTKICANQCSNVVASCVRCGVVDAGGQLVAGDIVNVLNPASADPLYNLDPGTNGAYLDLYYVQGNSHVALATVQHAAKSYVLGKWSGGNAMMGTDPLCSTGTPRYQMTINADYFANGVRGFDFPIYASPAPSQYDLVVSPLIGANGLKDKNGPFANSARPNDIRVVISWVGAHDFYSGFLIPNNNNALAVEGLSIAMPTLGPKYYLQAATSALWYHSFGQTVGQTNVESFTLDSAANKMTADTYLFYVRADNNNPMEGFRNSANLKVDVYMPEYGAAQYFNLFARPYHTYYLRAAAPSQNPGASYWHVFDIRRGDIVQITTDRVQEVTSVNPGTGKVTTYQNGRIETKIGAP